MAAYKTGETQSLNTILNDIRNKKTEEGRARSLNELQSWMLARGGSGDAIAKTYQELAPRLLAMINSPDNIDKIAGLSAIDRMSEVLCVTSPGMAVRLAGHPWIAMPNNEPAVMAQAAKVYARLVHRGGALIVEHVEKQIRMTFEWLAGEQPRHETRRYAAVLVLRELAKTAPGAIYDYVPEIFECIWTALRDPKQIIRETAAVVVKDCLKIISTRDEASKISIYTAVQNEAQVSFQRNTAESIHGALMVMRELVSEAGLYVRDRYREICEQVFSFKDHKESVVRRGVILLIPALARYDHSEFVQNYLHRAMVYLLGQLKKEKDRTCCFGAIGAVAIEINQNMAPYLDAVLTSVKEGLEARGRKGAPAEDAIFSCVSQLARAVGQALTKHMHDLLDLMFAYGLSEHLVASLVQLSNYIPPLLPTIQERLLNLLSVILSGDVFVAPGAPKQVRQNTIAAQRELSAVHFSADNRDAITIELAINTLGTFDFTGIILNEFIRECVVVYLDDDSRDVRHAAAQTCCKLFSKDPVIFQTSNHAIRLVSEVLEKLLVCAIADPDANIRSSTLLALDTRFDRHLAQAENVRSIFIALNDEVYAIREIAIKIIGRLANHNPAYVMPSLRKTLIQLLTELDYATATQSREESATLIGLLVGASQRLTKPYVLSILQVLLPKAKDSNPNVASSIMLAMGELARVGGEDILPKLDEYMSLIIENLHDQASAAKRDSALHTLGLLCSHTGYVIDPYLSYPGLLGTLVNILKTENAPHTRRETARVMGIIGALDPYRQTVVKQTDDNINEPLDLTDPSHPSNIGPSHEDFFPTVAFGALLNIMKDPSLVNHHTAVVEAVMYIFRSLRLKCVTFLPQVIPAFLGAMRNCPPGSVQEKYYFQNLGNLITMVKQHIRTHLDPILVAIKESWHAGLALQVIIVDLIEAIALALEGEFKIYLPILLPLLLQCFDGDYSERKLATQLRVAHAFAVFGSSLEDYLHLVIPVIVRTFEKPEAPMQLRRAAIQTTGQLCRNINFADHASRVIHPLARILANGPSELRSSCMEAMCALVTQVGLDFAIFVPMINKVLVRHRIVHPQYEDLVGKLLKGEALPSDPEHASGINGFSADIVPATDAGVIKLPVNQQNLKSSWETPKDAKSSESWREWMKRLSVQLLKSSPSHSLRACANLAEVYNPLARDLFNAAFVSCWTELYDSYQEELVRAIDTALGSNFVPGEIMQTLLNLAEFMEHDDKSLPIQPKILGEYAQKCHAFAKALHYKEIEWTSEPNAGTIESLIKINNQLQQPDVAVGILTHAQSAHNIELKEDWYEKLERWEDALAAYERKQDEDPDNFEVAQGRMRCLHALGEWESLSRLVSEHWPRASHDARRRIAPLAAAAAWGMAEWDLMDDYISGMKSESADRAWFRAISSIHRNQFHKAQQHINKVRDLLHTELTTLAGESYNRAYGQIVRVQMLAELEEIIQYKESGENRDRRQVIQKGWMKRLQGCQRDVEVWQRILKVRALVMSPRENMEMWIKFANLCRKSGRLGLAEKTLTSLFGDQETNPIKNLTTGPPHVIYAHLKYLWATGAREETLLYLREFTARLSQDLGLTSETNGITIAAAELARSGQLSEFTKLLARCYYKLGEWQSEMQDDWASDHVPEILSAYMMASELDNKWCKAWHAWALANSEVVAHFTQAQNPSEPTVSAVMGGHLQTAVKAFFRSIALSPGTALQDTLRLLTLWFKYGHNNEVNEAIAKDFATVSVDTWLEVIPQLIARIHAPSSMVRKLIQRILADVGKAHPQALVYPLTVASKYPSAPRRRAALSIIERMREHSAELVDQALLVSQELIRVAILWHEMWHEGLEEASRLYYGDGNVDAMFAVLDPLHDMLERGPETLREISFVQQYGRELLDARASCKRYQQYGELSDLNQAWDTYYHIFKKIARTLPQLTVVELQFASPKLLNVNSLELAIPGTYQSGKPVIRIEKFVGNFDVLTSKQRPRKLKIKGSDGKQHTFLLKGHEDLRQDERVMQLFGLVNTLLAKDAETFKRHLHIVKYPVIPLAPNSGLLGWVDNTDTFHVLVKNYRDSRKILLNIEHRLMQQMAPDYDHMCIIQKIEVFEYALDNTTGQDLYKVLWLKSRNSESWLERRTTYSRTLATMSMVGHILGLGDRHPSNLLLDRISGAVIHVDFGDCFEVAQQREKYPEKVPFRLTRMLTQAMEVSGIEGTFRITSENSMRVLRENKESILAVLEAFVHDPLINWRLIHAPNNKSLNMAERPQRRPGVDETNLQDGDVNDALNQRALQVIDRVHQKLTGRDFKPTVELTVRDQVQKLIMQATSLENLCQCFCGWCFFW